MSHTLVRVYDSFPAALNARNALLGSGFSPSNVELHCKLDEAGPVDGNFILNYDDTSTGPRAEFCQSLFNSEPQVEGPRPSDVTDRGSHVLMVNANDDEQLARADDITRQFGAINLADRIDKPRDAD